MLQTCLGRLGNDWQGIVLPVVLMLTGIILVGGDLLGLLSLDSIQNYWPMAVIVVGLTDLIAEPKPIASVRREHARQL